MEKVIPASAADEQFCRLLDDVAARGDTFVVERDGAPVAAVVPIEVYERWKRQRDAFFTKWQEIAEQVNLPEDEAMSIASDAVQAVRRTA